MKNSAILMRDHLLPRGGRVKEITFNRPEARNALSKALLQGLQLALESVLMEIEENPASIRCLILSANGRAFCVGADLKERAGMPEEEVRSFLSAMNYSFTTFANLPIPTIAVLSGYALGGGLELALCADLRLAASDFSEKNGKFLGLPETSLGIIPGAGGTQRLSRIVGLAKAKELIFTARRFSAAEALEMGLVTQTHPLAELSDRALELAERISQNAPLAVQAAKKAIDEGFSLPLKEGLALEQSCYGKTLGSRDRIEALRAFQEKRSPEFLGA